MNRSKFVWKESIDKEIVTKKQGATETPKIKRCEICGSASTSMVELNSKILCAYCYNKEYEREVYFEEFDNIYIGNHRNKK